MDNLRKKIRQFLIEQSDDNPLDKSEIFLFKYLNKYRDKYPTKHQLIDFIEKTLDSLGISKNRANEYYMIYVSNFRPDGDYEKITKSEFIDVTKLKKQRTSNMTAYQYTRSKLPFKGNNLEGIWGSTYNNKLYYVVKSYNWYPIYLFIDKKWYKVNDSYSRPTSKQMSHSNPIRWDDGIENRVTLVTRSEMDDLLRGREISDLKYRRAESFVDKNKKYLVDKPRQFFMTTNQNKKRVSYTIQDINSEDGKVIFDIKIDKVGSDKNGYIVPSPFSEEVENAIKEKLIDDYFDLSEENTEFNFKHPK